MTFNEYQKKAITTELMKRTGSSSANEPAMVAKILGLVGESGEVAEKFKKIIRDKNGIISSEDRIAIQKELGDVLWYVSELANYLGISLEKVAEKNLDKLFGRRERGTASGSGDNR